MPHVQRDRDRVRIEREGRKLRDRLLAEARTTVRSPCADLFLAETIGR